MSGYGKRATVIPADMDVRIAGDDVSTTTREGSHRFARVILECAARKSTKTASVFSCVPRWAPGRVIRMVIAGVAKQHGQGWPLPRAGCPRLDLRQDVVGPAREPFARDVTRPWVMSQAARRVQMRAGSGRVGKRVFRCVRDRASVTKNKSERNDNTASFGTALSLRVLYD